MVTSFSPGCPDCCCINRIKGCFCCPFTDCDVSHADVTVGISWSMDISLGATDGSQCFHVDGDTIVMDTDGAVTVTNPQSWAQSYKINATTITDTSSHSVSAGDVLSDFSITKPMSFCSNSVDDVTCSLVSLLPNNGGDAECPCYELTIEDNEESVDCGTEIDCPTSDGCPMLCGDMCNPDPGSPGPYPVQIVVDELTCICDADATPPFSALNPFPCPDDGVGNYNGTFTLDNFVSGGNDGEHCSIYAFGTYLGDAGSINCWWLYMYTATTIDNKTWTITVSFCQTGFEATGGFLPMATWQTVIDCELGDTFPTGGETLELLLISHNSCWDPPASITIGCPAGDGMTALAEGISRKPTKQGKCKYLGEPTGETAVCVPCGNTRLKTFDCGVFGQCTKKKKIDGMGCCNGCESFTLPDEKL
jgi:hypothetical protein